MKNLPLNLLLSVVLAGFLILWIAPLLAAGFLYLALADARVVLVGAVLGIVSFAIVTWRMGKAWRAIPDALQPKNPPGVQLRESDAPEMFAMAAKLKDETGMPSAVECWCDVSPTISAVAYAEHVAAETKIALRHGIAALAVMTRKQLEIMLHYHLSILTFSPRLMSMMLKARLVSEGFGYFLPYVRGFNWSLRKVERYARACAANLQETTAVIELSHEVTMQFQLFWMTEMQMFLNTGNLMPVVEGFTKFWLTQHPESKERPAIEMLNAQERMETRLTSELLKESPGIERISWEQGGVVLLESWKQAAADHAEGLSAITAGGLCEMTRDGGVALGSRLFEKLGQAHDPDDLRRGTSQALGMGLAAALDKAGWRLNYTGAGSKIRFENGERELEPFRVTQEMLDGKMECGEWALRCEQMGIGALPLA